MAGRGVCLRCTACCDAISRARRCEMARGRASSPSGALATSRSSLSRVQGLSGRIEQPQHAPRMVLPDAPGSQGTSSLIGVALAIGAGILIALGLDVQRRVPFCFCEYNTSCKYKLIRIMCAQFGSSPEGESPPPPRLDSAAGSDARSETSLGPTSRARGRAHSTLTAAAVARIPKPSRSAEWDARDPRRPSRGTPTNFYSSCRERRTRTLNIEVKVSYSQ